MSSPSINDTNDTTYEYIQMERLHLKGVQLRVRCDQILHDVLIAVIERRVNASCEQNRAQCVAVRSAVVAQDSFLLVWRQLSEGMETVPCEL